MQGDESEQQSETLADQYAKSMGLAAGGGIAKAATAEIGSALSGPVGQQIVTGGKAALKELPSSAIRRIPYAGKVLGDIYDAGRNAIAARPLPITDAWHGPDEYPITNELHGPEAPSPITNVLHGPESVPREVLQGHALAEGGRAVVDPAASLGGIPVRAIRPAQASTYPPEGPIILEKNQPMVPGSKADIAETKAIQEQVRDAAEGEDRARLSQARREWFARNQPGSTKGELTGTADRPVRYTKTPGVNVSDTGVPAGTKVPAPDEDLIPLLRKSLRAVKGKKGD